MHIIVHMCLTSAQFGCLAFYGALVKSLKRYITTFQVFRVRLKTFSSLVFFFCNVRGCKKEQGNWLNMGRGFVLQQQCYQAVSTAQKWIHVCHHIYYSVYVKNVSFSVFSLSIPQPTNAMFCRNCLCGKYNENVTTKW